LTAPPEPRCRANGGKINCSYTAESTAQGQCLFSSVGLLLCGSGSDAVSLWLRGRCVFELVEHWALYTEWFNAQVVRDLMLHSLVGSRVTSVSPLRILRGPTSEVILLLANVLERRIVVVKKFSRQLSKQGSSHTSSCTFASPLRESHRPVASARTVRAAVLTGDHYRPLKCSEWLGRLPGVCRSSINVASMELSLELRRLSERGCCGKVHCHQATD
jgi:hypothetical protein